MGGGIEERSEDGGEVRQEGSLNPTRLGHQNGHRKQVLISTIFVTLFSSLTNHTITKVSKTLGLQTPRGNNAHYSFYRAWPGGI